MKLVCVILDFGSGILASMSICRFISAWELYEIESEPDSQGACILGELHTHEPSTHVP